MSKQNTIAYVPIENLSGHLSVKVTTIRQWVKQGSIPKHTYIKVGNTYRFNIPEVLEALRAAKPAENVKELSPQYALDGLNENDDI